MALIQLFKMQVSYCKFLVSSPCIDCHTANVQRKWVVLVEIALEKCCLVNSKVWTSVVEVDPNRASITALLGIIVI